MTYKFLENIVELEKNLWKEIVEYEGVDKEMQNFVAMDRNDVIEAKTLYQKGEYEMLKGHIDYLDTFIREGVVVAFAKDLGEEWVKNVLGYEVN